MFEWLTRRSAPHPASASPTGAPPVAAAPRVPQHIDHTELSAALAGGQPPLVLDVRTAAEFSSGHMPRARHLPLHELRARAGELPAGRPIVCVCRSGHRSAMATQQLRALGYPARNLTGGMMRWRGPVVTGGAS